MIQRLLIGMGICLGLMLVYIPITGFVVKGDKMDLLKFMEKNPDKAALTLVYNGETIANYNGVRKSPLASTVKIIIAIEYATQAADGTLNADQMISLEELDQYYAKYTDGGAHPAWLKNVAAKIEDNEIPLREIAKGMILYSSNANTEWLIDRLGIQKINARIKSLGLEKHDSMNYIVSALFMGKEIYSGLNNKILADSLAQMSLESYLENSRIIHEKLKSDKSYKEEVGDLSFDVQRIWSDHLPGSTTMEYTQLLKKMNSKTYFSKETHVYLDEVMEYVMANPANSSWLKHLGMKGGSTAFVLTKALYATDLDGNTIELAYFFNDLNIFENAPLQKVMNDFELGILQDEAFRNEIATMLNKK